MDSTSFEALFGLGGIFLEEAQNLKDDKDKQYQISLESSINYYNKCIDYNPQSKESFCNRAIAAIKLDRYEEACKDLDKAISLGFVKAVELKKNYCD
jgi:tetratricopeptide (TPR) repeat protein